MQYIHEEFSLNLNYADQIRRMTPHFGYNGFGEAVYYRSYSRIIRDDFDNALGQECWADTVIRVVNGIFSIRKDWYIRNNILWDERFWQLYAYRMAISLFRMEWMPPGRGLWAMGTDLIRGRGAMPLYNCAFTEIAELWDEDLCWMMDCLMNGVGVGFRPKRCKLVLHSPVATATHVIQDTREGWVESVKYLLLAFAEPNNPIFDFDYSLIRPFGSPIKTFGGTASGPEPLRQLHQKIIELSYRYIKDDNYDEIQYKTDLANLIGVCVVSGNVRRSAEIALCEIDDPIFGHLKDYNRYPERKAWGWMSNNSVVLSKPEDFQCLDDIANANIAGYDVGYLNMKNVKLARVGRNDLVKYNLREDKATGLNPCGEIPLEHREVCNLAETLPTRCATTNVWLKACEYATFYCSTVALLPTHQPSTNAVIARNRRIGVSLIDYTGWKEQLGVAVVTAALREGYKRIRAVNTELAQEAGIPESIRVTTVKPGGSVPKLPGRTSGASHPTYQHTLRRMNVGEGTPTDLILKEAGVPYEPSVYTPKTNVFEFPIIQGPARPATEVSIWEQAMNLILLQREWADNAVSNTLYFKPRWSTVEKGIVSDGAIKFPKHTYTHKIGGDGLRNPGFRVVLQIDGEYYLQKYNPNHEEDDLESVLSAIAPLTKSVSLLPHMLTGFAPQMPEEGITPEEYDRRIAQIRAIDWSKLSGSDGEDEKFCVGDNCAITHTG